MIEKPKKNRKSGNSYLKYSGLGFQMVAIIMAALWLGSKIDTKFNFDPPYFTILFILLAFGLFMTKLVVDLSKEDK